MTGQSCLLFEMAANDASRHFKKQPVQITVPAAMYCLKLEPA